MLFRSSVGVDDPTPAKREVVVQVDRRPAVRVGVTGEGDRRGLRIEDLHRIGLRSRRGFRLEADTRVEAVRRAVADEVVDDVRGRLASLDPDQVLPVRELRDAQDQRREDWNGRIAELEKANRGLAAQAAGLEKQLATAETRAETAQRQAAAEKAERAAEEKRMEDEFKRKLMEKFAEDERLEQMNAQRRRMREQEHRREIERLWQEKLAVYQMQRDLEIQELASKKAEEARIKSIVEEQKRALLAQHSAVL